MKQPPLRHISFLALLALTSCQENPLGDAQQSASAESISATDNTKVSKAGDTMTGALNLPANGLLIGANQFAASGGNIGIGTASPATLLHLFSAGASEFRMESGTSNTALKFFNGSVERAAIYAAASANTKKLETGGASAITVDATQKVGIGTATPAYKLEIAGNNIDHALFSQYSTAGAAGGKLSLARSRSDTVGTHANVTIGDVLGDIDFNGDMSSGGNFATAARIRGDVGDVVSGHAFGQFHFLTRSTGGALVERMTIDSDGDVGIGTTSPPRNVTIRASTPVFQLLDTGDGVTAGDGFQIQQYPTVGYIYQYENRPIIFGTNSLDRVTITADGNVGIGTSTPSSRLVVTSTTVSGYSNTGITVDAPGTTTSDYSTVFRAVTGPGTATDLMVVRGDGNVGIGDTSPDTKLKVVGALCVKSDDGDCAGNVAGTIYANNTVVQAADYAEYFLAEARLEKGSVVGLNPVTGLARAYRPGDQLLGIVSTNPGVVGNSDIQHQQSVLVALMGQVPFRSDQVRMENNIAKTVDGKTIGYLLASGDLYVNISSVGHDLTELARSDLAQNNAIAKLQAENAALQTENRAKGQRIDALEARLKRLEDLFVRRTR